MLPQHLLMLAIFTLSLMGLALHRKHLVSALLCIEGLLLSLFIGLSAISLTQHLSTTATLPITLLTMSACEAGAGLALLAASSRTHATDHLKTMSLLKC